MGEYVRPEIYKDAVWAWADDWYKNKRWNDGPFTEIEKRHFEKESKCREVRILMSEYGMTGREAIDIVFGER